MPADEQKTLIAYVRANALKDTLPISEDSAPGVLPNIIAARIASVYDFNGPSYTVDAACASVLAAMISGIQGFTLGEYDAVICGGADMPLKQLGFIYFSALNALSPDGSFPFDKRANGFVMGQGAGTVILKRLEDAIKNKDTIYAVITGFVEASDGKGKYIAAPNEDWQARTIEKACRMAGYPVDTIEMIEAHGTATIVGDVVEVNGLKKAFASLGSTRKNYCGLTSVKSNIGHLKSAAGIAGFLKAVLALHHKMLPPTANFREINPKLQIEESPFYILDELREWPAPKEHPRRANVSAFGFGGADYHIAMQEYREEDYRSLISSGFTTHAEQKVAVESATPDAGAAPVSHMVFFSADNLDGLKENVENFTKALTRHADLSFSKWCLLHNFNVSAAAKVRLALLAASPEEVQTKFAFFLSNRDQLNPQMLRSKGIFFKQGEPLQPEQTAVLFPGQASQYLNMLKPLYNGFDQIRQTFQQADAFWFVRRQQTVSDLIYRPEDDPEALENLKQTQHAHPAIFISSLSFYQLLGNLGLKARYMIGHSLGEITALAAAEKLPFEEALQLVYERGYAFHEAGLNDTGKMISILATRDQVAKLVKESGLEVSIANINSPKQIIVAGASEAIDQFKKFLDTKRVTNKLLFVSHAFHSPLMEPVAQRFLDKIRKMPFRKSDVKVIMNHSGNFYPDDAKAMARIPWLLRDQILQPVNFVRSIEKLYEQGVRLFVEVGPNAVLSNLCKDILKDREDEVSILASNYKNADDWETLQKLIAALFAEGVAVKPPVWSKAVLSSGMPAQTTSLRTETVQPAAKTVPESAGQRPSVSVVYSGVSIGLPGSYKNAFRDDNFEQIFEGRNFLERLTDEEKQRLVDLQITKLVKEAQGPTFKLLSSLDEVIQLAGKVGKIDMIRDYHIDEKELQNMTSCIALGIAAGYEALKDAHIPLVREYVRTSTGKLLPQKLALPREMQDETGVIFANGFPMIDPVIEEVSRYISYHYGAKTRKELMAFYEAIIERVNNQDARKLLTDWYTLFYQRLKPEPDVAEVYQFNYHFMNQISAQANNRLASLINARGPNFQMNAACSSTSNAISIAEDFIRSGRVKRMIVIGADDPTSPTNFRWLGAGFLCTGAVTNEGDLYRAAVPFDRRRNGMIISAGAVGVILEEKSEIQKRGIVEVCELLGSHSFNTAGHPSQIDARQFTEQLDRFMARMETQHHLKRDDLSRQLLYLSHETYTPPRGGCSQTEAEALKRIFPGGFQHIIVGNTKGMTGHAMGASLEDAVAAKALQYGKVPPVVNLSETDPMFEGLNLSRGGRHDRRFVLKMTAGFGSQGNFILLKKAAEGDHRIVDNSTYLQWLKQVSGDERVSTEETGRLLVIKDNQQGQEIADSRLTLAPQKAAKIKAQTEIPALQAPHKTDLPAAIIGTISEITGYPEEMLEKDMELVADLGISADKQEAILQQLGQKYGLEPARIQLPEEATVGQVVNAITRLLDTGSDRQPAAAVAPAPAGHGGQADKESIKTETLKVFSEITKYPVDRLDLDMEMEADLGIDTVKQATILSILGEKYMLQRDDSIQLSNYPTIGHIIDLVYEKAGTGVMPVPETEPETETESVEISPQPQVTTADDAKEAIKQETLKVFSEITKYPEDMLDLDMEMEADLGIDTVKQATILSILGEKYQLQREDDMQLSNYPTIGHIVNLLYEKGMAVSKAPAMTDSVAEPPIEVADTLTEKTGPMTLSNLSRQVPVLVDEPLGKKEFSLAGKKLWLIGSNEAIMKGMAGVFRKKKAAVQVFVFRQGITAEELRQQIAAFTKDQAVDVIIDTTHIGHPFNLPDMPAVKVDEWLFLNGTARFLFYKHLADSKKHPQKILCLTAMDGFMGLSDDPDINPDPTFGALSGFYKAMRKEWTDCAVKIIDLDPQGLDEDGFMNPVIAEIEKAGPGVEIAYGQGKRQVIKIDDRELLARASLSFTEKDTILISGAGTGIAAEVTRALARKYPANFIIMDIIALPDNIEALAGLDDVGLQDVKEKIRQQLQEKHRKVTPVMLNNEYEKISKAVEVHRNLNALKGLGRNVEYIQADIRNYEQIKEALAAVKKKLPKISVLIHAAGVEKSHLLEQKSPAEFELVFGVKVLGALNLMRLCRDEPLKLVVAFSSISGRFGNAAQLDYSAANSFLNHWIRFMHKGRKNLHALALIWSGWKDVGMAWRNEFVRQKAEEMGLHYIEIDEGIQAFIREVEQISGDREVLLHKGLAHFVEPRLAVSDLTPLPLIDRVLKSNGRIDKAFRVFSVKRDALIEQHRLGKIPILPAVAYSELAAEYFALQAGKRDHYLIRKLTFANAFKLFHEQPRELYIQGNPLDDGDSWKIEIKSDFKLPKANQVQTVLHSECIVSAEAPDYSDMNPENWELGQEGLIRLPADESLLLIKSSGPDQRIILGPLYNDVVRDAAAKEPVLIYPDSTIYPTYFPQEQLTNAKYPLQLLLTNPCFLDSIYQACAAHLLVNKKRVYLPWYVEELGIIHVPRQPGLYKSYTKVIADTDDRVTFQVSMVDGNGQICYYAKKATFHKINL